MDGEAENIDVVSYSDVVFKEVGGINIESDARQEEAEDDGEEQGDEDQKKKEDGFFIKNKENCRLVETKRLAHSNEDDGGFNVEMDVEAGGFGKEMDGDAENVCVVNNNDE